MKKENPIVALPKWSWPVDLTQYDRLEELRPAEAEALKKYIRNYASERSKKQPQLYTALHRLVRPLEDVIAHTALLKKSHGYVILFLIREMARRDRSFWGWSEEEWIETINARWQVRQHLIAIAYLLCSFTRLESVGGGYVFYEALARKIFGHERIEAAIAQVRAAMTNWRYSHIYTNQKMQRAVCEAFLFNRSPELEAITLDLLRSIKGKRTVDDPGRCLHVLSCVLVGLGFLESPLPMAKPVTEKLGYRSPTEGVPAEWARLCRYWSETSTLLLVTRRSHYHMLLNIGRWLAAKHPEITSPEQWTRNLAAECLAMVCEMRSGDWSIRQGRCDQPIGKQLSPHTRLRRLDALRTFFRDLQEWGLIARKFDPQRCFAAPKNLLAQAQPNPRVISDDVWAKLLWAGLNLTVDDLRNPGPSSPGMKYTRYPIEMIRALVITWLFAGLRINEIFRLRVGCIRWQREDLIIQGTEEVLPKDAVCFLDVPVSKTNTAYSKPVDRAVGEAIAVWERVRPAQPRWADPKTGEMVDLLFRGYGRKRMSENYLNEQLIPLLCRKAGVAKSDVRGNITSHRARSTIATQLYNAKDPMSLFELQGWLGHRCLHSTQYYAKITPTKLAKAYSDAGYFGRNIRAIEVLIDQETIRNGARLKDEPWKYYDLGHGYCTYDFFDQCPHRMACAKCSFYLSKDSSRAQLLEAKVNLERMIQEIPLREEERAAVDEGMSLMDKLIASLRDVPTPSGATPREIGAKDGRELPVLRCD